MTNWQVFKVIGGRTWESKRTSSDLFLSYDDIRLFDLDKYVEFANGYEKSISVRGHWRSHAVQCGGYARSEKAKNSEYEFIEIDLDRAKFKNKGYYFENDVIRIIPEEVAVRRKMESVASVDPNTLAIARDAMDRVDRGESAEFEYKIMDNSNLLHHLVYSRKK